MNISDSWIGMEGILTGNPILIRVREQMQEFIDSRKYKSRFDIILKYQAGQQHLMPTDEQMELLETAEQDIAGALHCDLHGVLCIVYLGNNQQVLYLYAQDVEKTAKRINAVITSTTQISVEIHACDDPTWKEYRKLLDTVSE